MGLLCRPRLESQGQGQQGQRLEGGGAEASDASRCDGCQDLSKDLLPRGRGGEGRESLTLTMGTMMECVPCARLRDISCGHPQNPGAATVQSYPGPRCVGEVGSPA